MIVYYEICDAIHVRSIRPFVVFKIVGFIVALDPYD